VLRPSAPAMLAVGVGLGVCPGEGVRYRGEGEEVLLPPPRPLPEYKLLHFEALALGVEEGVPRACYCCLFGTFPGKVRGRRWE
jgi:hypothetical protein